MKELPKGWSYSRLDEVATIIRGVTYSSKDVLQNVSPDAVMLLRATNIQNGVLDFLDPVWIPRSKVKSQQMLIEGDVVIASSSGSIQIVGKSASVKGHIDATFGAFCTTVRATSIEPSYLSHYLQDPTLRQKWSDLAGGSNINNLKTTDIAATLIPVPPLYEQKRIITALDEHLSRLDKALTKLDHADSQTHALRSSILNEILTRRVPDFGTGTKRVSKDVNGTLVRLADLAMGGLFCDGDWVESKDQDPNGTIRLLQLADIGDGDFKNRSSRWLRPDQAESLGVTYVEKGDILIARMPDPLGRACIVPKLATPAITAVDVAILRIKRDDVDIRWLMWWLNSPETRSIVASLASGTTRQRITRKNLEALELHLPPLDQQKQIVEAMEDHLSRLDVTRTSIASQRASIQTLRRSLLNKAFNGELGTD